MHRSAIRTTGHMLAASAIAIAIAGAAAGPARAQDASQELARQVEELRRELATQRALIADQAGRIADQQRQIGDLMRTVDFDLAGVRGRGAPGDAGAATGAMPLASALQATTPTGQPQVLAGPALPDQPVGEAPPVTDARAEVRAIPQDVGVLTPAGSLVFDPSLEYTRSSTNRLVFRGIELIPGIQIGLIEATDADRDTIVATGALRYGVTNRLEVEARVPYLYRNDRIEVVQQRDEGIVRTIALQGDGVGDVELTARYQLNRARPLKPIWVASVRVKTDTGKGPFDIGYDEFGVATGLARGSGFWGVQPGISFLLPSDPVVIYGGLSYLYHIARDINRTIGETPIGRVDPGDAISANIGFGFALNPRLSYSMGYRHNYVLPTKSAIGDTIQRSNRLHVGQFNLGMSYRVTEKYTLNLGFEFGVTEDAPDVSITLRLPIAF